MSGWAKPREYVGMGWSGQDKIRFGPLSARSVVDDRQVDVVLPQQLEHPAAGVQAADVRGDVEQHHRWVQRLHKMQASISC